jgi:hypothetical protein
MPVQRSGVRRDLQPSLYHNIPGCGLKTHGAEPIALV